MRGLKRAISFRQRAKRIVKTAGENKTGTGIVITWIIAQFTSAFAKSLPDLNPMLISFYQWIMLWDPGVTGSGMARLLFFNVLFWPLAGVVLMVRSVLLRLSRKNEQPIEVHQPFVLYKEELAAAIEAIDNPVEDSEEPIRELLLNISETVALNLRIRKKEYRMYFVVPDDNDQDKPRLSGFRVGKIFEWVAKDKIPEEDFRKILHRDANRIEHILSEYEDNEIVMTELAEGETVLFLRNPGKRLRLGLYVAISKKIDDEDIQEMAATFSKVAQIVTTLGFIDTISSFVVKCKENGGADHE
jgi:hypothetical protein